MAVIRGYGIYADCFGCKNMPHLKDLYNMVLETITASGMKLERGMTGHFPQAVHRDNWGDSVVTLILPLAESHMAVHTWPDYKLICIDLFTCGDAVKAQAAVNDLIKKFEPEETRLNSFIRG